jgi:3D (Asp-Asp-Asp) domain-containing protein
LYAGLVILGFAWNDEARLGQIFAPGATYSKPVFTVTEKKQPSTPVENSAIDPNHRKVTITAYSSSRDETDDTPFITASGKHVRRGIVAANWLPFGARVRIPKVFGRRVLVVEDRMNRRFSSRVDVWMHSKRLAKRFGVKVAEVKVISLPHTRKEGD